VKLFLPLKFNIGPKPPGLSYRLEALPEEEQQQLVSAYPDLAPEDRGRLAKQLFRVRWLGPVNVDPDTALGEAAKNDRGPTKVEQAAAWVKEFLAVCAYPSDEIVTAAKAAGFTFDNVKEAKARLKADGLRNSNKGRFQGEWWNGFGDPDSWTLRPDPATTNGAPHTPRTPHTPDSPESPHYGNGFHSGESGECGERGEKGEQASPDWSDGHGDSWEGD